MSGRGQRLNKKRKTCPPVQLQPPKKYSLKGRVTKNDKTLTPNTTDTQLDYSLMEGTSKQTTTKEINKRKKKNEAVMEEEEENEDVVNDTERSRQRSSSQFSQCSGTSVEKENVNTSSGSNILNDSDGQIELLQTEGRSPRYLLREKKY